MAHKNNLDTQKGNWFVNLLRWAAIELILAPFFFIIGFIAAIFTKWGFGIKELEEYIHVLSYSGLKIDWKFRF